MITWNVDGASDENVTDIIISFTANENWHVMLLQEVSPGSPPSWYTDDGHLVLTGLAYWRCCSIVINKSLVSCVHCLRLDSISPAACLKINGSLHTFISCHLPHSGKSEEELSLGILELRASLEWSSGNIHFQHAVDALSEFPTGRLTLLVP